jgi:hypothetical protein
MPKQGSRPASWQQLPQHAPTEKKQRFAGAFTGGIPCVLDTFVGLPAALVEPAASAHLRVVEPARTSARDITLALSTRLCCVTRAAPLHVDRSLLLTCKLCSRDTNGHTVYVYMYVSRLSLIELGGMASLHSWRMHACMHANL